MAFVSCWVWLKENRLCPHPLPSPPHHLFRDVSTTTPRASIHPPIPSMQVWVLFSAQAPGRWPSTEGWNLPPGYPPPLITCFPSSVGEQPVGRSSKAWAQTTAEHQAGGKEAGGLACTHLPHWGQVKVSLEEDHGNPQSAVCWPFMSPSPGSLP